MINHRPPESPIQSIQKASNTLEEVGILDHHFPDIGELFSESYSSTYKETLESSVQPILARATIPMPVQLLEIFQKRNINDSAGIFPEINRAYFVVKNQIYLWNYNNRQVFDVYEDAHEIVGVAVVKPKADVFNNTVTHVLIVASVQEINVIAINYKNVDGFNDKLVFYTTGIMTSASGIRMKTIVGTINGRVFMLGNDGNVYELEYRGSEGWFSSRCYKTLHKTLLSSWSFYNTDVCVDIAASEDGQFLYRLSDKSVIQAIYLGKNGDEYNIIQNDINTGNVARLMCPNSELLNSDNFKIISIKPTSPLECKHYQLVAVTSTGVRLYLTHNKDSNNNSHNKDALSKGLELYHVRLPPRLPIQSVPNPNAAFNTVSLPTTLPSISKSFYNHGVLLLVSQVNGSERLLSASPDIGHMAKHGQRSGFIELTNSFSLSGNIINITEISDVPFELNELKSTLSTPSQQFLALTTTGLTVLTKMRPIDMLRSILINTGPDIRHRASDFEAFFDNFGTIQSTSLCYGIIASIQPTVTKAIDAITTFSPVADVSKGATELLNKYGSQTSTLYRSLNGNNISSRHDGLALFIYRLIHPIWTKPIMKEIISEHSQTKYDSTVSRKKVLEIQQVLRKLQGHLDMKFIMQRDPLTTEELSTQELCEFINLLIDAISFYIYLLDSDIVNIMNKFPIQARDKIKSMTYKELLTTTDGRVISKELSHLLIKEYSVYKGEYPHLEIYDILSSNSFFKITQ
ncbi:unnamed protein product [Cunninghamella echinulata]